MDYKPHVSFRSDELLPFTPSPAQRLTLAAICDTLIPCLTAEAGEDRALMALAASDLNLAYLVEQALEQVADTQALVQLKQFLQLLESRTFNGILFGYWSPFSRLTLERRTDLLYRLATHRLALMRRSFVGLKRLATFLFYATLPDGKVNPAYRVFHYQLPSPSAQAQTPSIQTIDARGINTLHCDVLIIGSGASGGVAAAELAASGQDVIVVEKGDVFSDQEFHGRELESHDRMLEKRGALTTSDNSMVVLAGSLLGGGTVINWSGALRPPAEILHEWDQIYGFRDVSGAEFQQSLDAVSSRIAVNTENDHQRSVNNRVFEEGLSALQYGVSSIPRNVKNCVDCGFCNFGCPHGAKQSTHKTYLVDAQQHGARILVRAHASRVEHRAGRITGASLNVRHSDGSVSEIAVLCRAVVLAAGSIHTPAILMRSGLTNPNIGLNLRLHPTTATGALFDRPIRMWQGAPMSRLCDEFANLDSHGYGVRLMNASAHPGVLAMVTPWISGRMHKRLMQRLEYTANIMIITRDRYSGRITLGPDGYPRIHYQLHPHDARHMMRGVQEALRIHHAAGAREVNTSQNAMPVFRVGHDHDFENFLRRVAQLDLRPNSFSLFSAHQMGSARIAGSARQGVANPDGECYEVKGLFLVDASVFPTCSGVNPMLTIMATAHFLAQRIKTLLCP